MVDQGVDQRIFLCRREVFRRLKKLPCIMLECSNIYGSIATLQWSLQGVSPDEFKRAFNSLKLLCQDHLSCQMADLFMVG